MPTTPTTFIHKPVSGTNNIENITNVYWKNSADKHRRDLEFEMDFSVFLKLWPCRHSSLSKVFCQKLLAKFFSLFVVLEWIGQVTYNMKLPDDWLIHLFSRFPTEIGCEESHHMITLPVRLLKNDELILQS